MKGQFIHIGLIMQNEWSGNKKYSQDTKGESKEGHCMYIYERWKKKTFMEDIEKVVENPFNALSEIH